MKVFVRFAFKTAVQLQELGNGRAICPQSGSKVAGIFETV